MDRQHASLFINREDVLWILIHSLPKEIEVYLICPVKMDLRHSIRSFTVSMKQSET